MNREPSEIERKQFVEQVGLFFEESGLPRMTGKVLGWLLICDPPHQSMNELVEALDASKASISNTTRLLIQLGFIERISLPGYRHDHYRIRPGVWYRLLRQRMDKLVAFRQLADRGLDLLQDKEPGLRLRLEEMRDMYAFFERELPPLLDRWEQNRR